jgi:FkbM family methyltransferase
LNLRRWLVSLCTKRKAGATEEEWKQIRISFSQFGEDLLLEHLLPPKGFYVDVGAYHPVTYSNTWLFSRNGWKGIVVEPNPGMAKLHRKRRPRDIIVGSAIGAESGEALYESVPEANNNRVLAEGETPGGGKVSKVRMTTLARLFRDHLLPGQDVDLLCIDCEGMDLAVLQGNDWERVRPRVVCVEAKDPGEEGAISGFLKPKSYEPVARAGYSVLYRQKT